MALAGASAAYQDCYRSCRATGATVQVCEEQCGRLIMGRGACKVCPTDCGLYGQVCPTGCDPSCNFGGFLISDVTDTLKSATGAVYQYGTGALKAAGVAAGGVGMLILGV